MEDRFSGRPMLARRRLLVGAGGACAIGMFSPALLAAKADATAAPAAAAPAAPMLSQIDLINLAAKQRMLVQRMAKLYAQSLVGARSSDAKRLLADSVSRFETLYATHKASSGRSGNYQVETALQRVGANWEKFRSLIAKPPAEKQVAEVASQSEELAKLINQTSLASAQFLSGSPIGQLVYRSGAQCYLSQRMAKYYFLRAMKVNEDEVSRAIDDARREFTDNAAFLAKSAENTTEIKFLLQLAATQWPYFEDAVNQAAQKESADLDYNVATTAENLLEVLERTNQLYLKLQGATA